MHEEKVAHNEVGCHEFCVLYDVSEKKLRLRRALFLTYSTELYRSSIYYWITSFGCFKLSAWNLQDIVIKVDPTF